MPLTTIPAIDQNVCAGWNEQQRNLYNNLPYYFAKIQVDRRKTFTTWDKFCGRIKWTPNMGDTMRMIRKEPSPHIRQFAVPTAIGGAGTAPKRDVIDIREMTGDVGIYKHRFETQVMNFLPSFRDFMSHVNDHATDIMEKQERFNDIYLRGSIFHYAPYIYVAGVGLIENGVPSGLPTAVTNADGTQGSSTAKSTNFCAAMAPTVASNLDMVGLSQLATIAETDLRIPPFSGSTGPDGVNDKFVLVCSSEAWHQFTFDPWLLANKNCALDVVNGQFRGDLFGRITCRIEDLPLRMNGAGGFAAPEMRVAQVNAQNVASDPYNANESVSNYAYSGLANSPYEWAFLVGAKGYDAVEVGPPPSEFTGKEAPVGFGKMFWNGEVQLTKNVLLQCLDENGTTQYALNQYGEYLQFISQVTYGIAPKQRRNIIPILFKRKRGVS